MPSSCLVVGGWWLVVGGWWLVAIKTQVSARHLPSYVADFGHILSFSAQATFYVEVHNTVKVSL